MAASIAATCMAACMAVSFISKLNNKTNLHHSGDTMCRTQAQYWAIIDFLKLLEIAQLGQHHHWRHLQIQCTDNGV